MKPDFFLRPYTDELGVAMVETYTLNFQKKRKERNFMALHMARSLWLFHIKHRWKKKKLKIDNLGAREMTPQLRALTVLIEDLGLVSSCNSRGGLPQPVTSVSGDLTLSFGLCKHLAHAWYHTYLQTLIHIIFY